VSIPTTAVTDIAPEFLTDPRVAAFLARAERRHNEAAWGDVYEDAMGAYAAHMLTRYHATATASASAGEVPGSISSRRAGGESEDYGSASIAIAHDSDAGLKTTRYGLDYLELRASRAVTAPTTIRVF
jgi:hypothetical protein